VPSQPEIAAEPLTHNHPSPQWRYIVRVSLPGGLVAPLAACRSAHRAAIVEEALRRLSEADLNFAQRVLDATLAERREASGPIKDGTWLLWFGRLVRAVNVTSYAEENLVTVVAPWVWDMRAKGETFEDEVAPRHELRVLTDEEGQRRRMEHETRGIS